METTCSYKHTGLVLYFHTLGRLDGSPRQGEHRRGGAAGQYRQVLVVAQNSLPPPPLCSGVSHGDDTMWWQHCVGLVQLATTKLHVLLGKSCQSSRETGFLGKK